MDGASFERVYDSFQDFHTFFAASFGRKQWQEHSRNYLQALLVQAQERRNAENVSERELVRKGLQLDPDNQYCIRIAERLVMSP